MIKTSQFLALGGLLALVLFAPSAHANILAPGGFGAPDVLDPGGIVLASTGVINYTTTGASSFSGQAEELVVADPGNTFGGGDLDFIYQVSVTAGPSAMVNLSAASFLSWLTDVGYCPTCSPGSDLVPPAGATYVAPSEVERSSDGSTVQFDFSPTSGGTNVSAGEQTYDLVIETNATSFGSGTFEVLDGSSKTLNGYAPTPEPVSSSLLLGGLFGLGLVVTRRFRLKQS
jgi:hypothetical protein